MGWEPSPVMITAYDPPPDLLAGLGDEDASLARAAWRVAVSVHSGQVRKDGARVIDHVVSVARNIREFGPPDGELLAAALLHDVVENTAVPPGEIEERFGARIAGLVDAVTNRPGEDARASALRARDTGEDALLLRLCDRLDGIRRSPGREPEKRRKFLDISRRTHLALAQERFPALAGAMRAALAEADATPD